MFMNIKYKIKCSGKDEGDTAFDLKVIYNLIKRDMCIYDRRI